MHLLTGFILALLVFALLRAMMPERPLLAAILPGVLAAALLAFFASELLSMEFWAGAVGFVAILSALLVVMHPNPMISVLFLILHLFCIALFYLMLQAQALAALQVIVYAGAIMVLFVFVIMLLNLRAEEGLRLGGGVQRTGALFVGALFAGLMFWAIRNRRDHPFFAPDALVEGFGTARQLGWLLYGKYLFAFEAASILLLAAMVGAVVLAKRRLQ
jgi:NADH-quinone oxidoreductase subunit J